MTELVKVARLEGRPGHVLHVVFTSGEEGEADFSWVADSDWPMVQPLKDEAFFRKVFVSFGVPTWPNGFDVDAINLHREMKEKGLLRGSAA